MADMKESRVARIFERLEKEKRTVKLTAEKTHSINLEISRKLEEFDIQSKERQSKSQIDAANSILTF